MNRRTSTTPTPAIFQILVNLDLRHEQAIPRHRVSRDIDKTFAIDEVRVEDGV